MLPVPILHHGMVRLGWSSNLAQGCYIVNQLAALRLKPTNCVFRVPCTIHSATIFSIGYNWYLFPTHYVNIYTSSALLAMILGYVQLHVNLCYWLAYVLCLHLLVLLLATMALMRLGNTTYIMCTGRSLLAIICYIPFLLKIILLSALVYWSYGPVLHIVFKVRPPAFWSVTMNHFLIL